MMCSLTWRELFPRKKYESTPEMPISQYEREIEGV